MKKFQCMLPTNSNLLLNFCSHMSQFWVLVRRTISTCERLPVWVPTVVCPVAGTSIRRKLFQWIRMTCRTLSHRERCLSWMRCMHRCRLAFDEVGVTSLSRSQMCNNGTMQRLPTGKLARLFSLMLLDIVSVREQVDRGSWPPGHRRLHW